MTGKTHILVGLNTAALCVSMTQIENPILLTGCITIGALLPDIDIATSKLGQKIRPLSTAIQMLIGHRTLFHAPILYILLWYFLTAQFPMYEIYITAVALGVVTHIILDCLNPAGIPLLYPWRKRFHLAKLPTNGTGEWLMFGLLSTALIGQTLNFLKGLLL